MTLRETWNDENSDVGSDVLAPDAASSQSTRLGIVPPSPSSPSQRPAPFRSLVKLGPGVQLPDTAYRITGWLGDGATGVVYRAEHVDLQREVALKILRPEVSDSAAVAEMLRREARNASRLKSEYIVEVHDLGELPDGRVWFAMPLLTGRSLDAVLSHEPMDIGRVVGILRQICKGLHAAHERGIIHRDVKPGNVMLIHDRGRADVVRMLDWGIAVQTPDAKRGASSTAGTPYYIAPEMVSRVPYDHRVDIYSLGCTAFEMLAGRPPFTGSDMASVLVSHVDDAPPDVRSFSPEVPEALAGLVARCLSKSAEDRFQDAQDLEAALCEAQCKAKLQTPWDDLPLPDVAPDRRAALASAMPDLIEVTTGRWVMPALAGAAAAAVIASIIVASGPDVGPRDISEVDQLSTSARRAAAKSFFLYPPVDDPDTDTAYEIVLRLEDLRGDARDLADERAATLRGEFADTLVHLGDKYWERPGGRPFAIDYYAEALIFVPSNDHAATRAALTLGELSDLRSRAGTREFTSMELLAVQPLVALAQPDPQLRADAIAALSDRDDVAVSTARRLGRIVDSDPEIPAAAKRRTGPVHATNDERAASVASPPDTAQEEPAESGEPSSDPQDPAGQLEVLGAVPDPARDREAAKALTARALVSLSRGELETAKGEFQRALAADNRYTAAHHGLSRLEFHRGNYARASRHGGRAVRLAPRNSQYRIDLGDAYYKAYRYPDAATQYEAAKRLGHKAADARLAKLAKKRGE